jgi:hypothetical protein
MDPHQHLDPLHQALSQACQLAAKIKAQAAKDAAISTAEIEAHHQAPTQAAGAHTQPLPQHKR